MENQSQSRWQNYGLWVSLASVVGMIINLKYPEFTGTWNDFYTVILTGLSTAGIISNPTTTNKGYIDD